MIRYRFALFAFLLFACENKSEEELFAHLSQQTCDTTAITYSVTVKGILDSRCNNCHDAANHSGEVVLDNYSSVLAQVSNGKLLSSIKHDGNTSPMPKGESKLSNCDIQKIERWILNGAPNN
ncbi:MAG: hypothetical protein NZ108_06005 [Bacteroidia bacterium]|nr:hypothetical protein [Bacteroidia bacterium]